MGVGVLEESSFEASGIFCCTVRVEERLLCTDRPDDTLEPLGDVEDVPLPTGFGNMLGGEVVREDRRVTVELLEVPNPCRGDNKVVGACVSDCKLVRERRDTKERDCVAREL